MKILLTGILLSLTFSCLSQDQCGQILQNGVYDIFKRESDLFTYKSYLNWLKSMNVSSYDKAKNSGVQATLPIEGIMVGLGLDKSESSFSKAMNALETYESQTQINRTKINEAISTANPTVVNAWKECINAKGTHIWPEFTHDPKVFFINAKFVWEGDSNIARYISNIYYDSSQINATNGDFMTSDGKMTYKQFTSTRSQKFTRKGNGPVDIQITPNNGETRHFMFAAIDPNEYHGEYNTMDSIAESPSQNPSIVVTNNKLHNVYLRIEAQVHLRPIKESNGCKIRLVARNINDKTDFKNFFGWQTITNLTGEEVQPLVVSSFPFPSGSSYKFEIYIDNGYNMTYKSKIKVKY